MYDEVSRSMILSSKTKLYLHAQTRPVHRHLCEQLDAAYHLIQPWQVLPFRFLLLSQLIRKKKESYPLELEAARAIGADGYDKLKYPISCAGGGDSPKDNSQMFVVFEDALTAKLTTSVYCLYTIHESY